MAQGEHFDLLILDLVMNGQRSVEAVRRIREKEDGTPLIFLTANREYAVESYEMNALDYMIKPLKKERLVKRLDQLFKRKNPRFSVRTQGDYSYYGYDELVYFEAREHRVYGRRKDGREFKCSQNLGRIEEQLREDPRFYRCHRGYIVNLDYVEQIREVMLLKGDLRVPYRLRNKRKIKEDYQRYVTENICFLKEGKGSGKEWVSKMGTFVGTLLCILILPVVVINCTLLFKSHINRERVPNIAGTFPMVVLTDSMYPEFQAGDLIFCHTKSASDVRPGM